MIQNKHRWLKWATEIFVFIIFTIYRAQATFNPTGYLSTGQQITLDFFHFLNRGTLFSFDPVEK